MTTRMKRTASAAAGAAAVLALAACSGGGTGSESSSPSASGSATGFSALAATALITQEQVTAIAGPQFEPYDSTTTASKTDPAQCLELLALADGTRTSPRTSVSSATASFARGSTGGSITNTVHVLADAGKAAAVLDEVTALVPTCSTFSVVVGSQILQAAIAPASLPSTSGRSLGVRITITSPDAKADVTSQIVLAGRSLVVGVAGTPDGADEASWASQVAAQSAAKAAGL